jgi:hypothetical protein
MLRLEVEASFNLHFHIKNRWLSYNPSNKEKLIIHILNQLKWKIRLPEENLSISKLELEAEADEDVEKAVNATLKIRGLRKDELEKLKKLPLKELSKELTIKYLLEG